MSVQTMKDRTILIILIALIVMTACAIAIVILFLFLGVNPPWTAAPTSPPPDPTWLRIQNSGTMVVGMSADYPPFAYIGPDFTIQGYDLALIQEIGKRLGVQLDIRNMAFDGLGNALMLGQIDAAVAAISITPERGQYVGFSHIYYTGEDALLARADSAIQLGSPNDLAQYRVGVQRGSVYEDWINDTLIAPGLMSPQSLVVYQNANEALDALTRPDPDIDLLMLDFQPAEAAARDRPVKIVARGFNPQSFAIAIPQGAHTLQQRLNDALIAMQNDGTLAALARQYLNIEKPPPIPTPAPTQLPATPVACLDGMRFVQDLSFPDSNMTNPPAVQPGQEMLKGWRIQNSGTCTWDNRYALIYTGSAPPNAPVAGNPVVVQNEVPPGGVYDIYVNILAPSVPGRYQSFWNLRNPAGVQFGDRLWVGFEVVGQAPPTPQPNTPTIYLFAAQPQQIIQGQCLRIDWQFGGENLTVSRIFRNNVLYWFDLPQTGSTTDCPPGAGQVEYRLTVDSARAGSASAVQVVTIVPAVQPTAPLPPTPEQPPQIIFFNADNPDITLGQCLNLSWSFSGSNIASATLFRNAAPISSGLPALGQQQDCPDAAGQYTYLLKVDSASAGSAQASQFVRVRSAAPPTPVPPVISIFDAAPQIITLGQCVDLNWSVSYSGQASVDLYRNGNAIVSGASYTGSYRDCISDVGIGSPIIYALTVSSPSGGGTVSQSVELLNR
ncbi:MAG: transporter substrate-binding domain-containing protein [Anaerolineae bacterium]|nr:transporter substrate-binding domain-containing protein [Anaerolineae bacterium]